MDLPTGAISHLLKLATACSTSPLSPRLANAIIALVTTLLQVETHGACMGFVNSQKPALKLPSP